MNKILLTGFLLAAFILQTSFTTIIHYDKIVVFEDHFDDNSKNWQLNTEYSEGAIHNGYYELASFGQRSDIRMQPIKVVKEGYDFEIEAAIQILENSDFLMLLEQKPESLASLRKHGRLVLSEYEHKLVGSVHRSGDQYSEAYLVTPVGRGVVRVVEDPVKRYMQTTHADQLARIAAWKAKGLTTLQACEECVKEDRSRRAQPSGGTRVA